MLEPDLLCYVFLVPVQLPLCWFGQYQSCLGFLPSASVHRCFVTAVKGACLTAAVKSDGLSIAFLIGPFYSVFAFLLFVVSTHL